MNIFPHQNVIYIVQVFLLGHVNVNPVPVIGNELSTKHIQGLRNLVRIQLN
jgi:hypothetical protein